MLAKKKPHVLCPAGAEASRAQSESEVAAYMKKMLVGLGFPKPPDNITAFQLFSKLESKIKELMTQYPVQIGRPLLKSRLSDKQWECVLEVNDALAQEYLTRKEMLLKRLDVTIQSFQWSDKAKHNQEKINQLYQPVKQELKAKSHIGVPEILAARDDLTRIQKTSTGDTRKECKINKVLIGRVPDRGGRAWELEPPPPEMPAFMKRDSAPQGQRPQSGRGGGGGGGGGGDFRGGRGGRGGPRVQGGWGGSNAQNVDTKWDQGGGGYGSGGGGRGGYQATGNYQGGGGGGGGYQRGGYHSGGGGGGGYQGGGSGYQGSAGYQGGGNYQGGGGGGGYHQGGGGYQGGGSGYQGSAGYQGGGGYHGDGHQGGGYHGGRGGGGGGYQGGGGGGYQGGGGGGYQGGGGRGGRGRGGRGRGR